jgi:hypothetical protein
VKLSIKRISKVVPIVFALFGSLPGPAEAESEVETIAGKVIAVGVPAGSIVTNLPAWSATFKSVAKVTAFTAAGPKLIKPFFDLTGPSNVVFAIIFSFV